jgi:WD40 repeat protein
MSTTAIRVVSPYKGLAPFEDSDVDALLFFGRERETEVIVANLLASKLTVLYGPSGVGKSSVLRAAVARRLRATAPDAEVVVCGEWSAHTGFQEVDGEAFFILDQFEEAFLYHEDDAMSAELAALLERPHVHVLIAMREDALARLDAFQARVPGVLTNRLRLDQLDLSAARAAIVGPLDHWNAVAPAAAVTIEVALVDEVLRQVESRPGRIEAPYLQLVMERVWEEERTVGSRVLHASTLQRLGGAEAIVSAHLERALASLPPHDAEIATNALKFLVTPSRTKIAQSFGDLVGYTDESPVELHHVLEILASQRILRASSDVDDDGRRYEIFHDVLAEPVLAWRREFESRAALAAAARRHRRLWVVAAGSLLLAAAMVVLAVFALAQRSEASKQRQSAQQQAAIARHQQHVAEQQTAKATAAQQEAEANAKAAKANEQEAQANAQEAQANEQKAQANQQKAEENAQRAAQEEQKANANAAEAQANQEQATKNAQRAHAAASDAQRSKQMAVKAKQAALHNLARAKRSERTANVGKDVALARANLSVDPVKSVQAALAAAKLAPASPSVEDALRSSLVAMSVHGILDGGGGAVNQAVFGANGTLIATGAQGGDVRIFSAATNRLLRTLEPGSPVAALEFSPDGTQLAVATSRNGALLYDVGSGKLEATLQHGGPVLDVVYAGGGKYVVTGSADFSTRIWDASTGALLRQIVGNAAQQTISVSPDGGRVAVLSRGTAVAHVYDVPSGDGVAAVQPPGEVTDLAFSPNGKYLVTTGRRNGFVWDTGDWHLLHVLSGHEAAIDDVAFAPDGRVVTASIDSSARVWDPATGAALFTLGAQHQQKVLAVAVRPDDGQVATASADQTARLWDEQLGQTPRILAGHTDAVTGLAYSPDGSLLLTASADGTARVWLTESPSLHDVGRQGGAVSTVAYSPDGKLVLSAGADGTAKLWRGTQLVQTLRQGGKVSTAAFTPDGLDVVTAGDDGTAKLWRAADGALLATYAHGAPARAVIGPGGRTVVTAGSDGNVRLWARTGTLRWTAAHGAPVTALAVSRDGSVASGGADGTVRLWRADGTAVSTALTGHTAGITSLAFSPDGRVLASGSSDSTARLWDARTGKPLHTLGGHLQGVTSVSFSPDGTDVLTSSVDGDAWIWRTATGRLFRKLKFHVSTVSRAAFSPDGRWVVTAGPTTAGIWQARSGKLLYFLDNAHGNLTWAAWAPDSLRIVAGDTGGGVESFTCPLCARTPELVAQAKARLAGLG